MKFLDLFRRPANPLPAQRAPLAAALEPRMLFDGAVAATVAETVSSTDHQPTETAKAQTTDDAALKTGDAATPLAATSDQRQEVVFIDGKVTNRQQLIDSIKPGVEVVTLDSSKDGLQQIADYLESRSGLDAIHILSHGDVGKISLGNSWLDSAALETQSGLLAEIGQSLARNGDILLYGCEVGAGEAGLDFIGRLANVTKADVAASADLTGASSLGGNWILEARHGKVETKGLEGLSSYNSLLAIPADEYFDDNPTQEIRGTNTFVLDGFRYTVTGPAGTAYDHYLNNVQYAPAGEGLALGGPTDNYLRFDTNGEGATSITIEVADGSAFRLMSLSFFVEDATSSGGPSGSFTITPAGGSALTYSTDTTYQDVDFSNNTGFYNITSITFSSLPGEMIYLDIDDLNVDAPITNTAPSVANAIPNQNATEDAAFNFQFAANTFSDVDADTLTYSAQLAGGGALPAWLSFNAATRTFSGTPTNANVGTLSIDVIANDGNGGTVTDTFNIIVVDNTNDAPTITATGNNPTYTENGSAVDLFNSVSINTIEAGQSITRMTLSVTNLADGSDELLRIDGTDIALLNGNSGTTASNGISYSVSVFSGTATIALSSAGGLSAATAQTVVDGMAYRNSSDAPSTATRVITLTSIRDSGGTANGGVDTTVTSISASVSVVAVNDAPIVISSGGASTFTEGGGGTVIDSGLTLSDPDNATLASTRITIAGNFQSGDVLSFSNDDSSMGNIVATYNAGTGVMTLTSAGATATLAQWQAALRSVTYSNGSDAPSTANRTISFVANDGQNDSTAATKIVSVTAVNDAPQITAPVSIGVTEDMPGAITGISFSDVDAGSANVTVTLTIGSGSLSAIGNGSVTVGGTSSALTLTGSIANINSFIAGSNLSFTTAANATADVTLTVSINDGGNTGNGGAQSANETITLQVTAVNDAPTITAPGSIAITEDIPGALTGISFSDVDAGSGTVTVTFSVPSGTLNATSGNGVSIGGTSSELTLTGSLADINAFIAASGVSFTTASNATANVTLTVMIDDGGNTGSGGAQTDTTNVTLTVTAVNDAPVNTVPSSQTMLQDGTLVFSTGNGNALSIADVDVGGGTMRVTLTASNGLLTLGSLSGVSFLVGNGTGDGTMVFEGNLSAINNALAGLSFAPTGGYYGPAAVQITTDDLGQSGSGGGQTDTDTILINVAQTNPLITGVASSSPDGAYKVGDTVNITVTFDQAVNVSGGTPTLLLETGAIDRNAVYVGGSGTDTLTFAYVVQAGDQSTDLDYAGSAALSLNGASIASVSLGNPAFTTLPAPGAADSLGANTALVIDGVAPVVSSVSVPANGTYAAGQNLDFTVNFSESVTVDTSGGTPRLAVTLDTGGTVYANYVSGSGTSALVFRFTVASGQADANGITVGSAIQDNGGSIRDAAGNVATIALNNVGATNGVLVDAADPAIVNVAVPPAGSYAAGSVLTFTVNLSEAVTVDTSGGTPQLQLDIGGRSVQADYVSGSGTSALVFRYTVQAGDTDSDGITISALSSNGSMLQDSSGNALSPNLVGVGNTAGVLIDTTPPAASSIIRVDASPTGASSVSYTVTFSENVTGVDASDFSLLATGSASGTIASVTQLNGQTYVVMVNGITGSGSLGLNLRAGSTGIADSAGNAIMGGLVGQAYAIDRPLPAVSSVAVPANGTYVAGQHLDFTVNFSESIIVDNSGGAPRIAVTLDTGGTVYASYVSGSGSNALVFRLTIAEGQLDSNGIDLGDSIQLNGATLKDASGTNASTTLSGVAATGGVRVDAQDPTASIAPLGASPTSAETVSFLVSFDESVTGVDAGDFNLLSSGTVRGTLQSVVQIDARTYQVTVTGVSGSGSLQIMLNASGSGISDIAGNRLGSNVISGGYEIIQPKPQPEGDPEFRANPPPVAPVEPTPLPQVVVPVAPPPSATTSPLLPPPLFEVPTLGSGIPTLGNIFINQGAMAPSFIAQVFANSADAGGDGSGAGFLGFGGGDAGIFGSSSLSSIFGKEVLQETEEQNIFKQRGNGGEGAVFGAPPLSQQLHQLHEGEQRQIRELAMALGQIHLNGPQA